jgi:4-carboxymuconolactone decarboxylase
MTDEQSAAHAWFVEHRGPFVGPYPALLRVPALVTAVARLGEQIRFSSPLSDDLLELAILLCARHWGARFPWVAHAALARKAGISATDLAALGSGSAPPGLTEDQRLVYDVAGELLTRGGVVDETYARSIERLGEAGTVALTATVGYYCLIAMVCNVDRHPVPADREPPFPGW